VRVILFVDINKIVKASFQAKTHEFSDGLMVEIR